MDYSSNPDSPLNMARTAYSCARRGLSRANKARDPELIGVMLRACSQERSRLRREMIKASGEAALVQLQENFTTTVLGGLPVGIVIDFVEQGCDGRQLKFAGAGPGDSVEPISADLGYTIVDSRGRPAPWVERKMTQADRDQLTREVWEWIENEKRISA